jgi:hypothetical protein
MMGMCFAADFSFSFRRSCWADDCGGFKSVHVRHLDSLLGACGEGGMIAGTLGWYCGCPPNAACDGLKEVNLFYHLLGEVSFGAELVATGSIAL